MQMINTNQLIVEEKLMANKCRKDCLSNKTQEYKTEMTKIFLTFKTQNRMDL